MYRKTETFPCTVKTLPQPESRKTALFTNFSLFFKVNAPKSKLIETHPSFFQPTSAKLMKTDHVDQEFKKGYWGHFAPPKTLPQNLKNSKPFPAPVQEISTYIYPCYSLWPLCLI